MKLYLSIIFCLLSFLAYTQDSTSHKFAELFYSNDFCYRFSSATSPDLDLMKEEFDSLEIGKYGFTTGINLGYQFNSGLQCATGLNFSSKGYRIDTLSNAGLLNMKFRYRYLEVPLRIGYSFRKDKKIQLITNLGVFAGVLIKHETTYDVLGSSEDGSFENDPALQNLNLGFSASFGIQKFIQNNYKFQLDGVFRQSLTSITNSDLKRYLNSTGIDLSIIRFF